MLQKWLCTVLVVLLALSFCSCKRLPSSDALSDFGSLTESSWPTVLTESGSQASAEEITSSFQALSAPSSETSVSSQSQSSSYQAVSSAVTTSVETTLPSTESEPSSSVFSQEQSVSSSVSQASEAEKQITVTLTICGVNAETMVDAQSVRVSEGSTVFTVLRDYAKQTGLEFTYSGGTRSAYVSGIDGLYEFDYGPQSGWLYRVNGDFGPASTSCGSYPVYDGDSIEWLYTIDRGADVGAPR